MNPQQEIAALEEILDLILAGVQEILMTGEQLDDQFQSLIAQELNLTADRIDQLRMIEAQTQETPNIPSQPQQNLTPAMPSSNINAFAYDPESGNLRVQFLGQHPNANGPVYEYGGVPEQIFDLFRKGAVPARSDGKNKWGKWWKGKHPSMGASLYTLLKTAGYPYMKLS